MDFETFVGNKKVKTFNERIKALEGFDLMQIGTIDDHQLFKIVINPDGERTICFIAGIHGDEPAGPLGMLEFLESKPFVPKSKRVVLLPLVNPTGFEANKRENSNKKDINREFGKKNLKDEAKMVWDAVKDEEILLLHTLHEDPDLKDFYLYYTDNRELAEEIRELAKNYFKIYANDTVHPITKEVGYLYKDKVHNGLIPLPHTKRGTIEDKVMEKGIPYITTETPGKALLKKRIEFNKEVIKTVIYGF